MKNENTVGQEPAGPQTTLSTGNGAIVAPAPAQRTTYQHMLAAKRWLVWTADKQPFYVSGAPRSGMLDTDKDRGLLGTYQEARNAVASSKGKFIGIGFALGPDGTGGYWQGIDLDKVPDEQLDEWAASLPGYVEVSPSGKGLHAIGYGRYFQPLGSNGTGFEAYASGRYFTVTEDVKSDAPLTCLAYVVEMKIAPLHNKEEIPAPTNSVLVDPKTVSQLRSALNAIPADDYDTWIRMGCALHELGNVGRELWITWSQSSDKWTAVDSKKWNTFKSDRTGYQAIFAEAQRRAWVNPTSNVAQSAKLKTGLIEGNEGFALPVPELRPEALYGVLGDVAAAGSANSEAVPATLAANVLAWFCATVGKGPYIALADEFRDLRIFVLVVGPTSKGRKGTSRALPQRIFNTVEKYLWQMNVGMPPLHIETSVSSGQGLVFMVRDPVINEEDGKIKDPGVPDKRVLLEISEFAGVLAQAKQDTSVLTATLRDAFDGRKLSTPNKNSPCFATGAHFVVIGHITREELTTLLTGTDVANGFANRFMMVYSARIKRVYEPEPTPEDVVQNLAYRIASAIYNIRTQNLTAVARTDGAKARWREISDDLEQRPRAPVIAKLTARDGTYIWILSAVIALTNNECIVDVCHMDAALAWVDYWEQTADFCFTTAAQYDDMILSQTVADEIVDAITALGGANVQHAAVADRLSNGGNRKDRKADIIAKGVTRLQNEAPLRVRITKQPGKGRPATIYSLVKR